MSKQVPSVVDLARRAWGVYEAALEERPGVVVTPSIPILFFGDSSHYFQSPFRVITVGLNPSRAEFPADDRFQRFPAAKGMYPAVMDGQFLDRYVRALNDYFRVEPYAR